MDDGTRLFLNALRHGIQGEGVLAQSGFPKSSEIQNNDSEKALNWDLNPASWSSLFFSARKHAVLPLVFEAVHKCPSLLMMNRRILDQVFSEVRNIVVRQAQKTGDFILFYEYLEACGLHPIVLKGIICRELYENPEHRTSTDEDLLIRPEEYSIYHRAITDYGLKPVDSEKVNENADEVSYESQDGYLYIEVHKYLFPRDSDAYGELNLFFEEVWDRSEEKNIYGTVFHTLMPTDHILYLLLHAFKHFLHSGFGIRQVSDIILFSEKYRDQIEWSLLSSKLKKSGAYEFACSILRIGQLYLLPENRLDTYTAGWNIGEAAEQTILKDILDGGVYGVSSRARAHSSTMTLNAVADSRSRWNKKCKFSENTSVFYALKSVFLPVKNLRGRYPYLRKAPFLLPLAWGQRLRSFIAESIENRSQGNEVLESISIGRQRIELFREYGILGRNRVQPQNRSGFLVRCCHKLSDSKAGQLFRPLYYAAASAEFVFFNTICFFQGFRLPDMRERELVQKKVTFIFKSFERQGMSRELCANISRMYPGVRIIVADDSKRPLTVDQKNVRIIHLPYNSGLSAGLAAALREVKTPYLVRLDDDELLTLRSNIHGELQFLMNHPEVDLVGLGVMTAMRCRQARKKFDLYIRNPIKNPLHPSKIPHLTKLDEEHVVLNKVFNLYIARTESVKQVGFDPNIRMLDHSEFFWRASGVITSAAALNTVVWHRHNPFDQHYRKFRSDYNSDLIYIRKKMGRMSQDENRG